jgi:hypothetical protein
MLRHKGAQPGNQNARKHGFYSDVLEPSQKRDLQQASLIQGIDAKFVLLRTKLKSIVVHDPDNLRLIAYAAKTLVKMVNTRQKLALVDRFLAENQPKRP